MAIFVYHWKIRHPQKKEYIQVRQTYFLALDCLGRGEVYEILHIKDEKTLHPEAHLKKKLGAGVKNMEPLQT